MKLQPKLLPQHLALGIQAIVQLARPEGEVDVDQVPGLDPLGDRVRVQVKPLLVEPDFSLRRRRPLLEPEVLVLDSDDLEDLLADTICLGLRAKRLGQEAGEEGELAGQLVVAVALDQLTHGLDS